MSKFCHLHVHSHYSILTATGTPAALIKRAKEIGMKNLALTDLSVTYGLVEFYKEAKQVIQPLGLEILTLTLDSRGAYRLELSNDIELLLGREKIQNRLERFARVFQKVLKTRAAEIARIDMRYSNGLAVGWRKLNKG